MSNKKLFIILVCISIASLLVFSFFIIFKSDISKKELGPSPFKAELNLTSDQNAEYKELIQLSKSIKGLLAFEKVYQLDLKNPNPSILLLQGLIKDNEAILEKATFELFKTFKFPVYDSNSSELNIFQDILKLMYYKTLLQILTKNFEGAKINIELLNNINRELIKKPTDLFIGLKIFESKFRELNLIIELVNQDYVSPKQKLEILTIKQDPISCEFFNTLFFYEIETYQNYLNEDYSIEMDYNPLLKSFMVKPNKSIMLIRKAGLDILNQLEKPSHQTYLNFTNKKSRTYNTLDYLKGNKGGIEYSDSIESFFKMFGVKALSVNSRMLQLSVSKKILDYKTEFGVFPSSLNELKLENELLIDIMTDLPFLYFAENSILQSFNKNNKNDNNKLVDKKLSSEEIYEILKDIKGDDIILYLK